MTMTIDQTTLCACLHINASHEAGEACTTTGCRCQRFTPGSRSSSHHYRRGQNAAPKRVARLEPGDRVLVGYPGRLEYVRGPDGVIIWEQNPGELTTHPKTRHVQDLVLRAAQQKTGALVAKVTGRRLEASEKPAGWRRASPARHVIETDLGDLEPLFGTNSVFVLKP